MNIYIHPNEESLASAAAAMIAGIVMEKPDAVLGLATGSTPAPVYRELARMAHRGIVSFAQVRTYNLDEYVGLNPDHPQSYRRYMNEQLFDHIDIDPANTHVPSGFADAGMAAAYDEEIQAAGGIDLQLLGIGRNGHIGFNEPAGDFSRLTHIVDLTDSTRQANARFFDRLEDVPRQAVSMGIGTIMQARRILLIATGEDKASAVRDMLNGAITPRMPASVLSLHRHVTVMLDNDAARLLNH